MQFNTQFKVCKKGFSQMSNLSGNPSNIDSISKGPLGVIDYVVSNYLKNLDVH